MIVNARLLIAGAVIAAALLIIWAMLALVLLTVWGGLSARSPEPPSPTIHARLLPALHPGGPLLRPHPAAPTAPQHGLRLLPAHPAKPPGR